MDFGPDRYVQHGSGRFGFYQLRRWESVDLIHLTFRPGDSVANSDLEALGLDVSVVEEPFVFQFPADTRHGLLVSLSTMLRAWVIAVNSGYVRSALLNVDRPDHRAGAHLDHLREWIDKTRHLAEETRVVFGTGSEVPDAMLNVAQRAEDLISWPYCRLRTTGPNDPQQRADLVLNVDLWALDQLHQTIGARLKRADWLSQIFEPARALLQTLSLPIVTTDAWKLRIWTIEQQIDPGSSDRLMADILHRLLRHEITQTAQIPAST